MTLRIATKDRVRVIAIDRPAARNAVDLATSARLFDAFLDLERDGGVDAAVLTGSGDAFCSGFDLKSAARGLDADWLARHAIPPDWDDPVARPLPSPMGPARLMLSKPVIAAVEGAAVAGGMELALWCDVRIVSQTAYFGVFCRRWGVPLIDGGTVRLGRIVGEGRARDLILSGRKVDAAEALAIGLANRVVPAGEALAAALDYARDLGRFPQGCLRADRDAAGMAPKATARALRREWQSAGLLGTESATGAARFAGGRGRGGSFESL